MKMTREENPLFVILRFINNHSYPLSFRYAPHAFFFTLKIHLENKKSTLYANSSLKESNPNNNNDF